MNKELIRLIQNMLIKKEPMLKKYIEYFKKAGTNILNDKEISPELRTIILEDITKDIQRNDFGNYKRIISNNPKYYHDNRGNYVYMEELNPDMIKTRIDKLKNRLNKKNKYIPKPTKNPISFVSESDLYEAIGDAYLKVKSNNIDDIKLLSNNLNKNNQEEFINDIYNDMITDQSSIINNQLISDGDEYTNSLKNLLYKQQKSKLLDKNYIDNYGEDLIDSPIKQYDGRDRLLYELFDMDKPKTVNNYINDISIFDDYRNKVNHAINKEEEIKNLLEDNFYDDLDKNLDDIFNIKNTIDFIKRY